MRFHYNSKMISQAFEQISSEGRTAYQKYLVLDFIFIVFFLTTMIIISNIAVVAPYVRIFLYIICGLRAMSDVIENILLLHMLGQYPIFNNTIAVICSWFTTFKFIMLYLWLISVILPPVLRGVKSLN